LGAGWSIVSLFPVWLFGTAIAAIPAPRASIRLRVVAALLFCPFVLISVKVRAILGLGLATDYVFGFGAAVFLWLLLASQGAAATSWWVRLARQMAHFSYTLYAVHTPSLIFLTALLAGGTRWHPDRKHILYGLAILFLTIGYAYAVARLTEFRTDRVRAWVERRVLGKQSLALQVR
jgi:peptidoglycan/LPS O-acetylase OafA/YrhL